MTARHIPSLVLLATLACALAPGLAAAGPLGPMKLPKPAATAPSPAPVDDGRDCKTNAPRYEGKEVVIRDHRTTTPLRCKIEYATHNLAIATKKGSTERALGWENALRRLEVDRAKQELAAASSGAKAAAQQKLDAAIDALDAIDGKLIARVKQIGADARTQVQTRISELESQLASATSKTKDELQARHLKAKTALETLERRLAAVDLEAAQRKLDNAAARVGAKAAELRSAAQAKFDAAKKKFDAAEKKLKQAIAKLEAEYKQLTAKLKQIEEQALKVLDDASSGIDDALEDLL